MIFSNKVYNILKWVVQLVLPAIGTLYFALASTWQWPNAEQTLGTIVAVTAFLGAILGISSKSYNRSDARFDGDFELIEDEQGQAVRIGVKQDEVPNLLQKDSVVLKVKH